MRSFFHPHAAAAAIVAVCLAGPAVANSHLMPLDANRDGYLSASELFSAMSERFRARDRNHDGKVSEAEMMANPEAGRNLTHAEVDAMLREFDLNGDRLISASELFQRTFSFGGFSLFDTNSDGKLSRGEARFRGVDLP